MKVAELLALLVDGAAGADVDEEGDDNDDPTLVSHRSDRQRKEEKVEGGIPNWTVERCNSPDIPLWRNPAPQEGVAVYSTTSRVLHKDEYKRWDQWNAIAEHKIRNLHSSESRSVELVVECEVDIDSHGERPECISRHEPTPC